MPPPISLALKTASATYRIRQPHLLSISRSSRYHLRHAYRRVLRTQYFENRRIHLFVGNLQLSAALCSGVLRRRQTWRAETVDRLTREFLVPYVELRKRRPGYAVSIVKAGLRVTGQPAGLVRPPLTDLDGEEMQALATLVAPYI